jgi:hypothetical protein
MNVIYFHITTKFSSPSHHQRALSLREVKRSAQGCSADERGTRVDPGPTDLGTRPPPTCPINLPALLKALTDVSATPLPSCGNRQVPDVLTHFILYKKDAHASPRHSRRLGERM